MDWNAWSIVVVAAVAIERAIAMLGDALTARAALRPPPERLASLYEPSVYRQSQAHARSTARLDMIESATELVAILGFIALGGFAWLDTWVRGLDLPFTELDRIGIVPWSGSVLPGIVFIGVLVLLELALQLPFSLWRTFVLEARFGLNRTAPRTFVLDSIKSLALLAVIGSPILALVIIFFERAGDAGWWLSWLLVTLVAIGSQLIVPRFVLPLFLRFDPLPEGGLRTAIERWAARAEVTLEGLFVVDGSRRSARTNAFVTGIGGATRIALFDTLIARMKASEVVAVLAHEVGHRRLGHLRKGLVMGIIESGAMLFLFARVLEQDDLFHAFGVTPSVFAGLAIFGLLLRPLELTLGVASNALSRRFEFEADAFAAESAGAESMVGALEALGRDNLSNLTPHPFAIALSGSHPPLDQRIAALEQAPS